MDLSPCHLRFFQDLLLARGRRTEKGYLAILRDPDVFGLKKVTGRIANASLEPDD